MKKKYQNAFFVFGVIVLAVMVTQLDFVQVWHRPAAHQDGKETECEK